MGAEVFETLARGSTAEAAFDKAVEQALHDDGHVGYTGTIAEKSSFVFIELPAGRQPSEFANQLIDDADERIDDKWGPAGCIRIGPDRFYFFGWASS